MNDQPIARDVRLAAALTIHHRSGNTVGLQEIVRETAEADRASALLLSVLDLHSIYIIGSRTPAGVGYLLDHIQGLAGIEPVDDAAMDLHRACRILEAHGREDFDSINEMLRAVRAQNRGTQTLQTLLDLYAAVLPELSSPAGKVWLDECVVHTVAEEAKGNDE